MDSYSGNAKGGLIMTRENEITIASRKYSSKGSSVDFEAGAKWADENPKNPWISVNEDLPCNHREYIDPEYNICTFQMLVKCKDGIYRLERMAILGGKWQWIGSGDDITHWMPVPPFSE